MRQENSEAAQARKKDKSADDFEGDIDDNESIESVSDDEFDKYLGKSRRVLPPTLSHTLLVHGQSAKSLKTNIFFVYVTLVRTHT